MLTAGPRRLTPVGAHCALPLQPLQSTFRRCHFPSDPSLTSATVRLDFLSPYPLDREPHMSAHDDYVKQNLDILRELQLSGMDAEEYLAWQEKIDDVNDLYLEARAVETDEKRTADERKRAKDVADGIAKAAPAITKSLIAAIKAFNKGDAINGAAEIMDICASLAPLISTFLNAAGPEGALIGAFFSVIGQILRCFGPKEESDVSKLEKFLNELKAQTELESIKAVHDAALAYARTLLRQAESLQTLLAKPLQTHEDYKSFYVGLKKSSIVLGDNSPHSSVSMFEQWKVLEYLEAPENQDVALWPTVLGICCKTYSDLVSTTMTITAMANTDDMLARLKDVAPDSTCGLSRQDRRSLEKKLLDLIAYAAARKLEYESCNARMLEALKGLTGAAQLWGLYGSIAPNCALKFTSGPRNVKNGSWTDVSDRNYYHQLMLVPEAATTIRKGQVSSEFNFKPAYHCFVLKSTGPEYPGSSHWVDHLWVHADTMAVDNVRDVLNNFSPAFTDIWAAGETDMGLDVFAGTAEATGAPGSVMRWGLDAKDGYNTAPLQRVDWWPQTRSAVGTIRAVTAPVSSLGDPDEAAIPPGGAARMIYASMRDSTDIYVNTAGQDHYLPGPPGWGPCTGITVDPTYLWLYQPFGFAVVSHASVLSHLRGTLPAPRWVLYPSLPPALLGEHLDLGDGASHISYNGDRVDIKPPLLGLISLSPCGGRDAPRRCRPPDDRSNPHPLPVHAVRRHRPMDDPDGPLRDRCRQGHRVGRLVDDDPGTGPACAEAAHAWMDTPREPHGEVDLTTAKPSIRDRRTLVVRHEPDLCHQLRVGLPALRDEGGEEGPREGRDGPGDRVADRFRRAHPEPPPGGGHHVRGLLHRRRDQPERVRDKGPEGYGAGIGSERA